VFVAPTLLQEFAAEHDLGSAEAAIRPVLAQSDPWLAGYFQMMETEIELYRTPQLSFDGLLLGQAQQLLAAHLLRAYSGFARNKLENMNRAAHARALRPHLLKRVYEFVDAHLGADICLSDLAQLAHVSERHFIRAFQAATGRTPYRFVIEQRLRACADLLRTRPDLSIAEIASMTGFRNRPHFSAKFAECFGVTPAAYRARVNL
jgi:AraC family transcriptional regulator